MSERFRLLFRGDLLEGQHPAVVRRKLAQSLGLDDVRVGRLFSGQPVIVKAAADADTAARIEAAFRKAGAYLEVEPAPYTVAMDPSSESAHPASAASADMSQSATAAASTFAPEVLPVGSDVLRKDERAPWTAREIETAHFELQGADVQLPEEPVPPPAPDTSRLSLLDP